VTGIILMYHRVAEAQEDTFDLAVAPQRFDAHVEYLQNLGRVVPLVDILVPSEHLQVAITFDDGYADNATAAAPPLAEAGLPATFFITTGRIGGQHFWWDRLSAGLVADYSKPAGIDVTVAGRDLWLALDDEQACLTSLAFLHQRLQPLPPDEILTVVGELLDRLEAPPPPDDALTMTPEQVLALDALPLVDIGAHTRTHLQLGGQHPSLQRDELQGSMADLTSLLGHPISSFAYPFGDPRSVGDVAPRLAREAGYALACSTTHGAVKRRSDRYVLPRLTVRDWEGSELAAQIRRLSSPDHVRPAAVGRPGSRKRS
jgi:peptidoglycan/xylan/chitin deacetylase (PgdA/CDA1 family)